MLRRAFTLIELLVVIAIIAILAAILFPVFAQAKASAKKTAALSNFKQNTLGIIQYQTDNDDRYPIFTYNNTVDANPANPDSVVLLMVQPYMKNYSIMEDPLDVATDMERETVEVINPSSRPAYKQAQINLNLAYKADFGLNWQFIDQLFQDATGAYQPQSITGSWPQNPGGMILAVDAVWNRNSSGQAYGGGNEGVDPPCVFDQSGRWMLPFTPTYLYYWYGGWNPSQPLAWNVFGGLWPWHTDHRQVVTSFMDGHAKSVALGQFSQGCNVRDGWGGLVTDQTKYMWDPL